MRLPDWLIIGAPKSGTTSLSTWLGNHPQVWATKYKELHFFDRADHYAQGPLWYANWFADAPTSKRAGEATPGYLSHPDAPDRVAETVPCAVLLAVLRDPVDRAYSHYWHEVNWGAALPSFDDVVQRGLDGDTTHSRFFDSGDYAAQLARWDAAGLSVHVHLFEDLVRDPARTFEAVCDQVGVERFAPPNLGEVHNASHRRRSPRLRRTMELARIWEWAPRTAMRLDAHNTIAVRYPPMSDWARARLTERYDEGNAVLRLRLQAPAATWCS